MNNSEITEQIKYNLNQLIQTRLKLKAAKDAPTFGTWDWWVRFIWGANKIQNYIYLISFTVAAIFTIYYTYEILSDMDSLLWIIYTLVGALILLVIMFYYSFKETTTYSVPLGGDPRFVQKNESDYPKDIRDKMQKDDSLVSLEFILPFGYLAFFAILVITSLAIKNRMPELAETLQNLALYTFAAIMIAINSFYIFLIPQLLIIGIIFQKIFSTNFKKNYIDIILWIFLAFISIYGIILAGYNQPKLSEKTCDDEILNYKMGRSYVQYFVVLGVLLLIIFLKRTGWFENSDFMKMNKGWGLFMEPIYYLTKMIIQKV